MADRKDAKKGTKIEGAAASNLDPAKVGVLVSRPTDPEVEGQTMRGGYVQCPWCDNYSRPVVDSDRYVYYMCGDCGNILKA